MPEQLSTLESPKPAAEPIYTGQDLFVDEPPKPNPDQKPGQEPDPLERILRPVAKAYGEQDGRHKRP